MTGPAPERAWWTPAQIAAARLPDLPDTRQGVDAMAARDGWRADPALARRRGGKGGGWEYHWRLFPARAQRRLLGAAVTVPEKPGRDEAWAWFDGLPDAVKARARARLALVQRIEALEPALGRQAAVAAVAREAGTGARTLWSWLALLEGVRADDRLPALAPRHRARADRPGAKDCDPAFMDALKSDWLRLEEPAFTDCWRRAMRLAAAQGWETLPERTMRRRIEREVSLPLRVLRRKGIEALRRMYPAQVRDKSALAAMEAVNGDFHRFDTFVAWPAAVPGEAPAVVRPQVVAFQDIHSGRILSWRVDTSANSTAVLLAAGDMIERWGIPGHVVLDNGREFAAKAVTGGAPTRFRFKVRDDDIPGLFTALGCQVHWATPYSGQSKPVERAFRDFARSIAREPRLAGAWTGNSPDAKPENHGSRAVPLETFLAVLAEGIEEHNSRVGRRSEVACGRSFAAVFDESYATAPIRKATAAQRRLWLMGAEGLRADRTTGAVSFQGNRYWDAWGHEIAGERVVIRFDPADLHGGVHVYAADGRYLGHLPCIEKTGFFALEEARTHAKARRDWINAEKRATQAHGRMTAADLGAMLDTLPAAPAPAVEARVVRPVFGGAGAPAAAGGAAEVITLRAAPVPETGETARQRFRRALELEARAEAGDVLAAEQGRWLAVYRASAEYAAERSLWDDFGDAMFV